MISFDRVPDSALARVMPTDPEFPLQFSPGFVRYCLKLNRQYRRPVRIGIDSQRRLPEILADEAYDRTHHLLFEESGCRIIVDRDDADELDGWTLVGGETLFQDFSFYRQRHEMTAATHPGRLTLNRRLLQNVEPELRGKRLRRWQEQDHKEGTSRVTGTLESLARHLARGDARAAYVIKTTPDVLVAAYTDELDCIAMLRFPQTVADVYRLEIGTRLIACHFYQKTDYGVALDLVPGADASERWHNFHPLIGSFLSADDDRLRQLEREIREEEWSRTRELAADWLERFDEGDAWPARDGSPLRAKDPSADPITISPVMLGFFVIVILAAIAGLLWFLLFG